MSTLAAASIDYTSSAELLARSRRHSQVSHTRHTPGHGHSRTPWGLIIGIVVLIAIVLAVVYVVRHRRVSP